MAQQPKLWEWPEWKDDTKDANAARPDSRSLLQSTQRLTDAQAKKERDYWSKCLEEIRQIETLTNDKFKGLEERLQRKIDEDVRRVQTSVTDEREEQRTAITEMRRDLGVQQDLRAQVVELRVQFGELREGLSATRGVVSKLSSRLDASPPSRAEGAPSGRASANSNDTAATAAALVAAAGATSSAEAAEASVQSLRGDVEKLEVQTRSEFVVFKSAVAAVEVATADCRRDLRTLREQQGLQSETATAELAKLRWELGTAHAEEVRVVQDIAVRRAIESVQESMQASIDSTISSLQGELRRELEFVKQANENDRTRADQQAEHLSHIETSCLGLSQRLEDTERKVSSMSQDVMSETLLLRGQIEANLNEKDEQDCRLKSIETSMRETQSARFEDKTLKSKIEAITAEMSAISSQMDTMLATPTEQTEKHAVNLWAILARLEVLESEQKNPDVRDNEDKTLKHKIESITTEMSAISSQMDTILATPTQQTEKDAVNIWAILARLEVIESEQKNPEVRDIAGLAKRITALEEQISTTSSPRVGNQFESRESATRGSSPSVSSLSYHGSAHSSAARISSPASRGSKVNEEASMRELRKAVEDTCRDVARLAGMIEAERQQRQVDLEQRNIRDEVDPSSASRTDRSEGIAKELKAELTRRVAAVNTVATEMCAGLRADLRGQLAAIERRIDGFTLLTARVGKLESDGSRTTARMTSIEGDLRKLFHLSSTLMHDRMHMDRENKKMAFDVIATEMKKVLLAGKGKEDVAIDDTTAASESTATGTEISAPRASQASEVARSVSVQRSPRMPVRTPEQLLAKNTEIGVTAEPASRGRSFSPAIPTDLQSTLQGLVLAVKSTLEQKRHETPSRPARDASQQDRVRSCGPVEHNGGRADRLDETIPSANPAHPHDAPFMLQAPEPPSVTSARQSPRPERQQSAVLMGATPEFKWRVQVDRRHPRVSPHGSPSPAARQPSLAQQDSMAALATNSLQHHRVPSVVANDTATSLEAERKLTMSAPTVLRQGATDVTRQGSPRTTLQPPPPAMSHAPVIGATAANSSSAQANPPEREGVQASTRGRLNSYINPRSAATQVRTPATSVQSSSNRGRTSQNSLSAIQTASSRLQPSQSQVSVPLGASVMQSPRRVQSPTSQMPITSPHLGTSSSGGRRPAFSAGP